MLLHFSIYPDICNDLFWPTTFSPVSFLGKGSRGLHVLPQRAKVDAAVMLAENTVLPQTFHLSDELAAQWKGIEPEIAFSQPQISSAPISVKQGLLARYILGLSLYLGFLDFPQASMQISVGRWSQLDIFLEAGCFRWWATIPLGSWVMLCQDIPPTLAWSVQGSHQQQGLWLLLGVWKMGREN